ncbi:PKD domain-containing protein [Taibaiella soli]|uniref:PKD domain-containing protein n=1 Tax=Taibaiella soli TaxID=1649169 RepID=A0A2W2AE74_9BACT|nr:PKD domain-containing protein [Taibaiella soli]PZF73591.1 hypothetical protein DN068_07665 [Taibaiella soli]
MASENFDKKIYLPVIAILVVAVAVLLIKFVFTGDKDVNAKISKNALYVNEPFNFEDNSGFAHKWKWEFGDGVISYDRGGQYHYSHPGTFMLRLTINDKMVDTFFVSVRDTARVEVVQDSIMRIDGPAVGMQFENLIFRAEGKGAKLFRWEFGDDKKGDTRDPFTFHTFDQPGNYIVELYTDINQYPIRLPIKILPAFQGVGMEGPNANDKLGKFDEDFKIHLQKIADHKNFDDNYQYLVNKYLCNNEKIVVVVNGQKYNEFFSYCAGLHYDNNVYIQQVKVAVDTSLTCVKRLEIAQQKQNL